MSGCNYFLIIIDIQIKEDVEQQRAESGKETCPTFYEMLLDVIDRWEQMHTSKSTKRASKDGTSSRRPVFFIIEEFDLFGKDKILYSILNLIQTNVVFACIGITSCLVRSPRITPTSLPHSPQ